MYCLFCGNRLSEIKGYLICTYCGSYLVKKGDKYSHGRFDGSIVARRFITELLEHGDDENDGK